MRKRLVTPCDVTDSQTVVNISIEVRVNVAHRHSRKDLFGLSNVGLEILGSIVPAF